MKRPPMLRLTIVALVLLVTGCSKPYVITTPLKASLEEPRSFRVTEISDALPSDIKMEDRPTKEDIIKFREYLVDEMERRDDLQMVLTASEPRYEIRGTLLSYKKGSGLLRFFIGFGSGNAKLTTELAVVDTATGQVVFGGNFISEVSHWAESGDQVFKRVARDFSKQLEKQMRKYPQASVTATRDP